MAPQIVCWNVNWAKSNSSRGKELKKRIYRQKPDVVCISEGYTGYLEQSGHSIYSEPDYGYNIIEGRRKVFLWSKNSWREVDAIGHANIPSGRFVSGITETSFGDVRIVGVCIAWQMAHVSTGQKNQAPWEVHMAYLQGLKKYLDHISNEIPIVLIGDFNQRIPRGRQPIKAFKLMEEMIGNRFDIWSAGNVKGLDQQPVCHVGGTKDLLCHQVSGRSRYDAAGKQLTDHDGLVCRFERL
jgi:exonuclease III